MSGTVSAPIAVSSAVGARETRAFALGKMQAQPHCIGNGQDVREQDRRVKRKAVERLQRHFGRERRRLRQCEEASRLRARCVVLGQVASRLPHQPDRRVRRGLASQSAQEGVVTQCRHEWRTEWRGGVEEPALRRGRADGRKLGHPLAFCGHRDVRRMREQDASEAARLRPSGTRRSRARTAGLRESPRPRATARAACRPPRRPSAPTCGNRRCSP